MWIYCDAFPACFHLSRKPNYRSPLHPYPMCPSLLVILGPRRCLTPRSKPDAPSIYNPINIYPVTPKNQQKLNHIMNAYLFSWALRTRFERVIKTRPINSTITITMRIVAIAIQTGCAKMAPITFACWLLSTFIDGTPTDGGASGVASGSLRRNAVVWKNSYN